MKRLYLTTALTCLVMLSLLGAYLWFLNPSRELEKVKIGFIYDNDESTTYTYNFALAAEELQREYGSRVEILTRSNVLDDRIEPVIRELAAKGCHIIFTNGYSEQVPLLAGEYPDIQFCQTSYRDTYGIAVPANYHTFKGEAYQGRYVSGMVAGMKLQELIAQGQITEDQAVLGFVAAFPSSEVISGYTAFLLGARSVVPRCVMHVRFTGTWSSFSREKSAARALIDEGCIILSQHTDTIGPAIACDEAAEKGDRPVYYVGFNQILTDAVSPTSLVSARINWNPYVLSAVDAVMHYRSIESRVSGRVHGTDVSAGFEKGWVEMVDLNRQIAAPGTEEAMDSLVEQFRRGSGPAVFKGDYTGTALDNPADTCDLRAGYEENARSSFPTFHYILDGIVLIDP